MASNQDTTGQQKSSQEAADTLKSQLRAEKRRLNAILKSVRAVEDAQECVNKGIDEHSNQLRKLQEQNDELTHVLEDVLQYAHIGSNSPSISLDLYEGDLEIESTTQNQSNPVKEYLANHRLPTGSSPRHTGDNQKATAGSNQLSNVYDRANRFFNSEAKAQVATQQLYGRLQRYKDNRDKANASSEHEGGVDSKKNDQQSVEKDLHRESAGSNGPKQTVMTKSTPPKEPKKPPSRRKDEQEDYQPGTSEDVHEGATHSLQGLELIENRIAALEATLQDF